MQEEWSRLQQEITRTLESATKAGSPKLSEEFRLQENQDNSSVYIVAFSFFSAEVDNSFEISLLFGSHLLDIILGAAGWPTDGFEH